MFTLGFGNLALLNKHMEHCSYIVNTDSNTKYHNAASSNSLFCLLNLLNIHSTQICGFTCSNLLEQE